MSLFFLLTGLYLVFIKSNLILVPTGELISILFSLPGSCTLFYYKVKLSSYENKENEHKSYNVPIFTRSFLNSAKESVLWAVLRNWVSTNIWDQFVLCFLFSFFTRNRMQVKPLFLLFISIPLTGGQYIRDVYVEGMLNCFHLGLKTTEEVHITGVIFSRFPGERRQARSERGAPDMLPDRESPLGIKQRRFSFWKKLC